MTEQTTPIKAVFFDIGGVVIKSPLIAIHAYEREKGLPKDWLNLFITKLGNFPSPNLCCIWNELIAALLVVYRTWRRVAAV